MLVDLARRDVEQRRHAGLHRGLELARPGVDGGFRRLCACTRAAIARSWSAAEHVHLGSQIEAEGLPELPLPRMAQRATLFSPRALELARLSSQKAALREKDDRVQPKQQRDPPPESRPIVTNSLR